MTEELMEITKKHPFLMEQLRTITDETSIVEFWQTQLEYGINKSGEQYILKNARNAELIIENYIGDKIAYDSFKQCEVINKNLPWRKRELPDKLYEPWQGADDKRLLHWMNKIWNFSGSEVIKNAYTEVSRQHSFHPVKEFIESAKWDGTKRIETFFVDYLGADDTEYVRTVTRKWFVAAVTRIYEPGCKFDEMVVLVGNQGIGKSWTVARIAGDWFNDSLKNLENKEAGEHLQGTWIVEFGEMAGMKKSEVEEIKAFLSKTSDSYRVAYDRVVSDFPRKCVFIGTTNSRDFLRDQTGNRRFYPIDVDKSKRQYNPFTALTDDIVAQVWAEALMLYKEGEVLHLDDELKLIAAAVQKEHTESDPREGIIASFLEMPLPIDWNSKKPWERLNYFREHGQRQVTGGKKRKSVCAAEIWCECLGHEATEFNRWKAREIADMIRNLGWVERKPVRTKFKHYGSQTTFIKELQQLQEGY